MLSNPGNKTMTHGVNSIDVTLNATDADTNDQANLTYSAKITSPSNAPVTVTHSGNVFTFTLSGIVSGTFTVQATASDGLATSSPVTFTITMPNHAPVFDTTPTDITAAHDTTPPTVSISATDADNDSLTYGASVTRYTALYDLKTKYALAVDATHAQNYGGANEKWLRGAGNKFFFIKPDGTFYQWNGTLHKATGTKLATLPPSVYSDTSLLYAAVNPPTTPGTATLSGSDVTITPATNFVGVFQVKFTVTDGYVITSKTVWVTFTNVPVTLAAISNQTMSAGTSLDVSLNVSDPDGDSLTSKVDIQGYNQLYNLDKQYGFFVDPTGYHQNFHFQNEKWIRAASGKWYAIKPNGQLWLLGNTNIRGGAGAFATLIATLDTSVYSDPTLLTKAYYNETTKTFSTAPTAPSVTYSLNSSNTVLTLTPPSGFTGVFQVTVTFSDGPSTASRTFFVTVS